MILRLPIPPCVSALERGSIRLALEHANIGASRNETLSTAFL